MGKLGGVRINPEKPRKNEPKVNFKDMSDRTRGTIYKEEVDYSRKAPKPNQDTLRNSATAKRAKSATNRQAMSPTALSNDSERKDAWRQKGLSFDSYPRRPEQLFPIQTSYTTALYSPNYFSIQKKGNTPPLSYATMRGERFPEPKANGADNFYNNDSGRGKNEKTILFDRVAGRNRPCINPHFRSFLDVYRRNEKNEEESFKEESGFTNTKFVSIEDSLAECAEFQSKLNKLVSRPHSANLNYLKVPWK